MGSLFCELDASMEFGSGYIAVVGPPSSGKTSLVLDYLVAREDSFEAAAAAITAEDAAPSTGPTSSSSAELLPSDEPSIDAPVLRMEYWTARSFSGDALVHMARRLEVATTGDLGGKRRRRLGTTCSPLDFGQIVTRWLAAQPPGSELHLVVDDADVLDADAEAVNTWLSGCLNTRTAAGRRVCLWLVSQLPLRVPNCYRIHFVSPLSVAAVCKWLKEEHRVHGAAFAEGKEGGEAMPKSMTIASRATQSTAREAQLRVPSQTTSACVAAAVEYFATHQPMCASVVCKDARILLQRVYKLLPALILAGGEVTESPDGSRTLRVAPNAVHYATVWGKVKSGGDSCGGAGSDGGISSTDAHADTAGVDPLVGALKRIGYSAVLLALAAFYCGAVPQRKQLEVFGASAAVRAAAPKSDAHAQSHKAAVLSAASQVISLPRLLFVYEAMLRMCVAHVDPLEFASADVAAHYVGGFQAWGLLTPVLGRRSQQAFHCWIPVSTAARLGKMLSLNLFDLIPT